MPRRKTHEEFIKQVNNATNNEYEVLEQYKNNHTKIKMKHTLCGNIWGVTPHNFLDSGVRCPECQKKIVQKKITKTTDDFKREVYNLTNGEYEVIGEYVNRRTKIKLIHNKCRTIQEYYPGGFIYNSNRCKECSNKTYYNTELFKVKVLEIAGDNYKVLGEYINSHKKILIKHLDCGNEWLVEPKEFIHHNTRCPKCFKDERKTQEQFEKEVYNLVKNEYSILGIYKNTHARILMRHESCGNEFLVIPKEFLYRNSRCPKCYTSSNGEGEINRYLKKNNIKFETQYKIKECKNKQSLPFDFAILNDNCVKILIEYQGIQHYKAFDFFGGEEKLKYTQKNDKIKLDYCKSNDIPLLRIPYWEFENINTILQDALNKHLFLCESEVS